MDGLLKATHSLYMSMSQTQLRSPVPGYALFALAIAGALLLFASAIGQLYSIWNAQPEYSYGILIPVLSVFLIWRNRERLRGLPFTGSWYGIALIVAGLTLRLIGALSTMPAMVHYAMLLVLYGLVLALTGPAVFRRLLMPLFILVFMVPLPPFLSEQLSAQLQLLSSQLGVLVIRAAGISVYLEGNVIDLGSYQLEVAEACSGLRYLFPLMTLAFMIAYAFGGPLWKRALVFLCSVPITVLMNSVRIGVIGITVDHWGTGMAEGVLHDFEGWAVFMVSAVIVLLVARGLSRIGRPADKGRQPTQPSVTARSAVAAAPFQTLPRSFIAAAALVAMGVTAEFTIPERPEITPARAEFVGFPSYIGGWAGTRDTLEPMFLDALRLDDYLLMNYHRTDGLPVNLYVAYYRSQRNGLSVHSPRLCLPGGGWEIRKFDRYSLAGLGGHTSLPVNRVLIEKGGQRQLVYYWFMERGRRLTNEYVVRWYLFWDAVTRNRTDGALVRLVVPIPREATEADADAALSKFAALTQAPLARYVPD
jgi:exosortase D (VPLPA-CTERM-specific)